MDIPGLAASDGGGDQRTVNGVRAVGEGHGAGLYIQVSIRSIQPFAYLGRDAYSLNGDGLGADSQGSGLGAVGGVLSDLNSGGRLRLSGRALSSSTTSLKGSSSASDEEGSSSEELHRERLIKREN